MQGAATDALADALARAEAHSPFLRNAMRRFPDLVDLLAGGDLDAALAAAAIEPAEADEVPRALRLARSRLALALGVGDLAGLLPLEEVVQRLSDLADQALDLAIGAAIETLSPGEAPKGFAVIALGKHGSRELNYSSDIDPILLFNPETLPRRSRDEPVEAAIRIANHVTRTLQARDGDGYVFRVDLRLRPNPEVTPVALPVEAAISYYESSALAWERAAFIRSRACAGDIVLGKSFLEAIRPFVWRRGLDFGAIREIRAMSHRIRDHFAAGQGFGPGYDLKRGRGGIRECEFFAQIHQMIHGGRDPSLRRPATLDALAALSGAGRIDAGEAEQLASAYRCYRTIEHRLQMVDDQQTHALPKEEDSLAGVARLHGLDGSKGLLDLLAPHVEAVGRIYDGLDSTPQSGLPLEPEPLSEALASAGFEDPEAVAGRIAQWRGGSFRALRTPAAQEALEAILPVLVRALAGSADPMTATNRLDALLERLPTAINLLRLLEARPPLRKLLTDILCHAPTLASDLSRRADLLDGLIDASAFDPPGTVDEIAQRLRASDGDAHVEQRLDRVRQVVGDMRFALGAQIMVGATDPLDVAGGYARVAEAAIVTVAEAVTAEFENAHGRVPESEFLILALGRMGGAELTHASDLDLVYLFNGDFAAESKGPKPLGAVQYYNRLAQRVTAGLSVPTAAGPLYDIDTRLRPSGAQGPLVVSLDAFERYQREDAWTWEHLALCRARPVYGSEAGQSALQAILDVELSRPRDPERVLADAVKMRAEMAIHKPPKGLLDVKLSEGGLVDLEFALHVTQLTHNAGFSPDLAKAIAQLSSMGLFPGELADAHRLLTRILVTTRLMAPDLEAPPVATRTLIAQACGAPDWDRLLADMTAARQSVSQCWNAIASRHKG